MNKRGEFVDQLIKVLFFAMIFGGLIFLIWIIALIGPLASELTGETTSLVSSAVAGQSDENLTTAVTVPLNSINDSVQHFSWISYVLIVFLFFTFLIMAYNVRTYPFMIVFWLVFIVVLVFVSMFLSNQYLEAAQTAGLVGQAYASWSSTDYVMRYLPHIIAGLGILGGIIMGILASREPEVEVNTLQ